MYVALRCSADDKMTYMDCVGHAATKRELIIMVNDKVDSIADEAEGKVYLIIFKRFAAYCPGCHKMFFTAKEDPEHAAGSEGELL